MSTSKSQNGPMGQKRTLGLVSGFADKDHLLREARGQRTDGGLLGNKQNQGPLWEADPEEGRDTFT